MFQFWYQLFGVKSDHVVRMSSYGVKSLGTAEIHSCVFPAETAGPSKMWKNPWCFTENYKTVFGKLNYDIFFKAVLIKSTAIV